MINNIFNFKHWWIGVVENRKDPEKMGRCQIRIFGYHTESKELLPTKDLPWAIPMQPITSAAISGVGTSPLGPVEGTWVVGFFLDGDDMQQPLMVGTIAAKVAGQTFSQVDIKQEVENVNDGVLKDSSGNPIKDSSDNPIHIAVPKVEGWKLGQTSEKYESGGRGAGTINNYNSPNFGDYGGASYGMYQFASYLPTKMSNGKSRPNPKNSPVVQYIRNSRFKEYFNGLEPATADFDNKWRENANKYPKEFADDQHDFIKRKYFDVYVSNLQRAGIDLTQYGPAVQDLIWSTSVQLGPANITPFTIPLRGKGKMTDRDIVELVSEYKINNVNVLFRSSSSDIRASVKSRYMTEKEDLLGLIV